ncbi:siderophore-interacting protein [Streptomyces sp. NPDC020965]|uniref:siderophore-interacting protein n=1 Tax=Streptomyces sp. NPDC020965 TaxID=3365105 RepID=UPI0037A4C0C2
MEIYRAVVARVQHLTTTMVRVTLTGGDLPTFTSTGVGDEYVRLFFPHGPDRHDLSLPVATETSWETPEGRPTAPMRTYTVRAVRPELNEIDIDFVVHDHGVAATWAAAAQPGDPVGLNSPTGLYDPPEDFTRQILIADLTGLPAVARLLENTPEHIETRVIVEVPDEASVLPLPAHPRTKVTWTYGGNGHSPSRLADLVTTALPEDRDLAGTYLWTAGETTALRSVRKHLRRTLSLPTDRFKVVGYWVPNSDSWSERWEALPATVKAQLEALWEDPTDDLEDVTIEYEDRLSGLGL